MVSQMNTPQPPDRSQYAAEIRASMPGFSEAMIAEVINRFDIYTEPGSWEDNQPYNLIGWLYWAALDVKSWAEDNLPDIFDPDHPAWEKEQKRLARQFIREAKRLADRAVAAGFDPDSELTDWR